MIAFPLQVLHEISQLYQLQFIDANVFVDNLQSVSISRQMTKRTADQMLIPEMKSFNKQLAVIIGIRFFFVECTLAEEPVCVDLPLCRHVTLPG